MKTYLKGSDFKHTDTTTTGILLVNLGTPDAPTPHALRRYLDEFLSDPRVTEMPRWLWWLILHGIILRVRPRRSAKNYAKIWTEKGSPLFAISQAQQQALQKVIQQHTNSPIHIALGMRYGQPSIEKALDELRQVHIQRLLILPLYPQYASSTTASVFDAVSDVLKKWRWLPDIRFISHYHDHPDYINALAQCIQRHWQQHGQPDKLLFSFHGIPKRFFTAGDPYHCECHKTARLVAEKLALMQSNWQVVFQSRFGKEEWLKPYTDHTLEALAQAGTKHVDVICPGFSADCLETLEEIDQENRHLFLNAGGKVFHYIPALNDDEMHIQALLSLIMQHMQGWDLQSLAQLREDAKLRVERADSLCD
jgi:ferrochelatase